MIMELSKLCFVCLKVIVTEGDIGDDDEVVQEETGKSSRISSVKILMSYIINSSGSGDIEKDKLQNDTLSSLEKGNLFICPECLLNADHLLKLHLELEKIQMHILHVLRNLKNNLKVKDKDDVSGDNNGDLFRFRHHLLQDFGCRELPDKAQVRLERLNIAGFKNVPVQITLPPEDQHQVQESDHVEVKDVPKSRSSSTSPVKQELEAVSVSHGDDYGDNEHAHSDNDNDVVSPFEDNDEAYKDQHARTRKSLKRKVRQRRFDARRRMKKTSVKPKLEICYCSEPESRDSEGDINTGGDVDDEDSPNMTTKTSPEIRPKPKKAGCWDCDICLEYIPYEDFQFHLKTHPEFEKIYTCVLCPPNQLGRAPKRFFGTYKGLVWHHLRNNHNVPLPCKLCPEEKQSIMFSRTQLCRHLYDVHHPGHKKIPCKDPNCPKEFYEPIAVSHHYGRYHPNKNSAGGISCDICKKKISSTVGLTVHMKRMHPQDGFEQFCCSSCPRVFNSRKDLRAHEKNYHENPLVECPHCSRMLRAGTALRQHIKIVHGDKQYQCQFCSLRFPQLAILKTHEETHGTERKYLCEHCPYAGTTQKSLRSHMVTVHEKKTFKCEHCPKAFSTKSHLNKHQNAHAKEKPYKCEICGAGFTYGTGRTGHLRKVHGAKSVNGKVIEGVIEVKTKRRRKGLKNKKEMEFRCEHCPKAFHLKISWEDHQRIHTGVESYKCEVCQEAFVNKRRRNVHRRKVHGIERVKKKVVSGAEVEGMKKEEPS